MSRVILSVFIFFTSISLASTSDIKEKLELKEMKKSLQKFYIKKEEEYKKRQKELSDILLKIEKDKKEITDIKRQNEELLKAITGKVEDKITKIYNKMKPKNSAKIFDTMINEGNFTDVFNIILKIKAKQTTLILKYLSLDNASMITRALEEYKKQKLNEEE